MLMPNARSMRARSMNALKYSLAADALSRAYYSAYLAMIEFMHTRHNYSIDINLSQGDAHRRVIRYFSDEYYYHFINAFKPDLDGIPSSEKSRFVYRTLISWRNLRNAADYKPSLNIDNVYMYAKSMLRFTDYLIMKGGTNMVHYLLSVNGHNALTDAIDPNCILDECTFDLILNNKVIGHLNVDSDNIIRYIECSRLSEPKKYVNFKVYFSPSINIDTATITIVRDYQYSPSKGLPDDPVARMWLRALHIVEDASINLPEIPELLYKCLLKSHIDASKFLVLEDSVTLEILLDYNLVQYIQTLSLFQGIKLQIKGIDLPSLFPSAQVGHYLDYPTISAEPLAATPPSLDYIAIHFKQPELSASFVNPNLVTQSLRSMRLGG